MNDIHVREINFPKDFSTVRLLWENAGPGIHLRRSDDPEEIKKKLQRDPDLFLIAEVNGTIVGAVVGGFDGRRGMVYHLAVEESFRKRGTGKMLMSELERRLQGKGCLRCYLLVTTDNASAIRFYEERGWERMDDVYTYVKDLK